MRKTFILIGILLAIFTIYLFAIFESYNVYMNEKYVYDIGTDKEIEIVELNKIAKECNVSPQIREYKYSTMLNRKINIYVLNPQNDVEEGIKKNIIPMIKVKILTDGIDMSEYISNFTVQTNDKDAITKLCQMLKEYNGKVKFSHSLNLNPLDVLCNGLNGKFFVSLFSLALFCTIAFYSLRTKEIGILKLNGWGNARLSLRMFKAIIIRTTAPYIGIIFTFGVYIMSVDISKITIYVCLAFWMWIPIALIYVIVAIVALIYIERMQLSSSIKNKKNNRFIYIVLICTKIIIASILFWMLTNSIYEGAKYYQAIKDTEKVKRENLYIFTSHGINDEKYKELENNLSDLDENGIYIYQTSDITYPLFSRNKYKYLEKTNDLDTIESNSIICSHNFLDKLKIKDFKDEKVKIQDANEEYYLIPSNLYGNIDDYMQYEGCDNGKKIIRIKSNQEIMSYYVPGQYSFNSIINVVPIEKKLQVGYAQVYFSEDNANKIKEKLKKMKINPVDAQIESINNEIDSYLASNSLTMIENAFFSLILLLTYCFVDISLFITYYEMKKKKIAIFSLNGKYTIFDIVIYVVLNILIVVILSIIINYYFIILAILEGIIFYYKFISNSQKNISFAIKGK